MQELLSGAKETFNGGIWLERLFLYTVVNKKEKRWSRFIVDRCNLLDFAPHKTCVVLLQLYCFQ